MLSMLFPSWVWAQHFNLRLREENGIEKFPVPTPPRDKVETKKILLYILFCLIAPTQPISGCYNLLNSNRKKRLRFVTSPVPVHSLPSLRAQDALIVYSAMLICFLHTKLVLCGNWDVINNCRCRQWKPTRPGPVTLKNIQCMLNLCKGDNIHEIRADAARTKLRDGKGLILLLLSLIISVIIVWFLLIDFLF